MNLFLSCNDLAGTVYAQKCTSIYNRNMEIIKSTTTALLKNENKLLLKKQRIQRYLAVIRRAP